ncbi:hypothetical protein [Paenibacillus humicola]|uniref:hypothetical protein n=1 Tax=Paenibacillus humicola TaxID=3110540 RepID=UPI00237A1F33|nr:hypothetical protein [Paenibacillus humicola]
MSFDELLQDLKDQKTNGRAPNSFDQLFNESFMSKFTRCSSFGEFLEKGNFQVRTDEDINNIVGELFDRHVARETDFPDWKAMLDRANAEHAHKK